MPAIRCLKEKANEEIFNRNFSFCFRRCCRGGFVRAIAAARTEALKLVGGQAKLLQAPKARQVSGSLGVSDGID